MQCEAVGDPRKPKDRNILGRKEKRIMEFLRRQAIDNESGSRAKLSAAVVLKGKIISTGRNQMKSHPFQSEWTKHKEAIYLHAEINAIYNSLNHLDRNDLKKAAIYIYRVKHSSNRSLNWVNGLAYPCEGCMRAIVEFGFKKVVYSTNDPEKEIEVI